MGFPYANCDVISKAVNYTANAVESLSRWQKSKMEKFLGKDTEDNQVHSKLHWKTYLYLHKFLC